MWKKGLVGVAKFGVGLLSVLILFNLSLLFSIPVLSVDSISGYFNVTNNVSFNWTAGNITIRVIGTADNITLTIANTSTYIYANYSQDDRYVETDYGNLTGNWHLCFNTTPSGVKNMKFIVQLENGSFVNTTKPLNISLDPDNRTNVTLWPHFVCPPGRYYGNFRVHNETNSSDYANVTARIDIPISTNNTLNETTYTAFFKGKIAANSYYHSYYFNTNEIVNVTTVTINLTGYTQDIDLFLFYENGTLIGQSINRSSGNEEIAGIYLPDSSEMWEIRVYGNTTSAQNYNGYLYYTTLNITNIDGNETVSSLDFGALDSNETSSVLNFTIRNEDDQNITNVDEHVELYHVDRWTNYNIDRNFTDFLVPDFAQKIKVKIEWINQSGTNITNWTLYLTDVGNNLINTSMSKYTNANKTNGMREEYIEYSGPFNTTDKYGYWNISVYNNTNGTLNAYNVTAYIWVNESVWVNSNYTDGFDFNSNGLPNSSYNVSVNITVPENDILNGSYEGFFEYSNGSGWKLRLPILLDVRTGMLIINNTLENATYRKWDNIGFNRTAGSNAITMNITFNNTGGYPIYYNSTNSSSALFYTENSSYYMNFTVDDWPSNPINDSSLGGNEGTINITVTINTTLTNNQVGTYRGWIFFNTTNSTNVTRQSALYETFNLTLEVYLTDNLTIEVTTLYPVPPTALNVSNSSENVTITIQVKLANESGNIISVPSGPQLFMDLTNFTDVSITETNVTTYNLSATSLTTGLSGGSGNITCSAGTQKCYINATIPEATVGGKYNLSVSVTWATPDGSTLTGTGVNSSFVINDTGLNVSPITSTSIGSFDEFTSKYFNASVKNFGPVAASGVKVTFNKGACPITVVYDSYSGCSSVSGSGDYFTFTINGYDDTGCWFRWKLTGNNVSSNTSCNDASVTVDKRGFYNITEISLTVLDVPDTGDDGTGDGATPPTPTYTHTMSITDYESVIYATLNTTNSTTVTVKHTGNVSTMTVKLDVTLSGINTTVSPDSYSLSPNNSGVFNVTFNVSNSTTLGNHSGTFKAYESTDTSNYVTNSFTLVVLSTPEREEEINVSYENYTAQFENLTAEFERIKAAGLVSEANLTRVGALINETNNTINDIKAAIDSGDYVTAESLLTGLATQLDRLRTELAAIQEEEEAAGVEFWGSVWVWVIVGIVIAGAVGLLIYMLLPPAEGYHVGYGYKPKAESWWVRIKNKIKSIKGRKKGEVKEGVGAKIFKRKNEESVSKYAKGYERQGGYDYNYGTMGKAIKQFMKRIKNLFQRRPQKSLYEYTVPTKAEGVEA